MLTVLEVTLPVFALVLCGWVAAGRGLVQDSGVEGINTFVFWFALSAMLFRAVAAHPVSKIADPRYFAAYLLAGAILFACMLWIARRRPAVDRTALAVSATHGILSQRYGVDTRAIGSAIIIGTFAAAGTVSFVIWLLQLRIA